MSRVWRGVKLLFWLGVAGLILMAALITVVMLLPESAQRADCIIVPGCKVDGTVPSGSLQARIDCALRLYRAGYARAIIVCGGQGADEQISEAAVMKDRLLKGGVPEQAVFVDERSLSTEQNMINAKLIMDAQGFRSAIVATSDFHAFRAKACAWRAGIAPVYTGKARYFWSGKWYSILREIPGWGKFVLTGLNLIEP